MVLSVSNYQLVGLPQIALNMLEALYLDNNRLTELPTLVGDLKGVESEKQPAGWFILQYTEAEQAFMVVLG